MKLFENWAEIERKNVDDRPAEFIAQEMSLRDLRKPRNLTRARVIARPLAR